MLLRTSVAAFAAAVSLGLWSEVSNSALAHDIYSTLRDRDGHLCCGGQDCRPVEATVLPDGNYYLPRSDEIIPADVATPSPDDRFHHCTYDPVANDFDPWGPFWESKHKTRCFFAPMNSWYPLPMPSSKFVWDPNHWRLRAEETRTIADQMTHEQARTIMWRIALDYDRLAKLAEEQLADQERGAIGDKT